VQETIDILRQVPLIQDLPAPVLASLASDVTFRHIDDGEALFHQGDPGTSAFIIHEGWVKIVIHNEEGEEIVLNQCGPGEVIGEIALIDGNPRSAGVIALSPVTAVELRRNLFLRVLAQQPLLALDVMRNFAARLRYATAYIEKAIAWSYRIAAGDYERAFADMESASGSVERDEGDAARAAQLLAAFFSMVEGVRTREEMLKRQVQDLTIEIDEARRRELVDEVAQRAFFQDLQSAVRQIRNQHEGDEQGEKE
jgi:CRP-like cAMP-binding protein